MPGFEAIKFSMGPVTIEKTEKTTVDASENKVELKTTVKDGDVTIPILYKVDSTTIDFVGIGERKRVRDSTQRNGADHQRRRKGNVRTAGFRFVVCGQRGQGSDGSRKG